jgi:hypothetical protein
VKLIHSTPNRVVFHLAEREKNALLEILSRYPCIPPAHQRLSKNAPLEESAQQLLEEALAEHRTQNRQELQKLLTDPARLAKAEKGWRLSLAPGDLEWVLQVLNDVRVGSWILLGSPDPHLEEVNEQNAPLVWGMEIAGAFQMFFLQALHGKE